MSFRVRVGIPLLLLAAIVGWALLNKWQPSTSLLPPTGTPASTVGPEPTVEPTPTPRPGDGGTELYG